MRPDLPVELLDGFGNQETLLSPALDPVKPDLRIACDRVVREGATLRLRLLISYQLPMDLVRSFWSIPWGMVAVVRDPVSCRAAAVRLMEPSVNYLETPARNFEDQREGATAMGSGWLDVPLEAEIGEAAEHPGLLIHVALHEMVSNVVRVKP